MDEIVSDDEGIFSIPLDILNSILIYCKVKDIQSFACSCNTLNQGVLNSNLANQVSNLNLLPYSDDWKVLRKYEEMNPEIRLVKAAEIGDDRIVNSLLDKNIAVRGQAIQGAIKGDHFETLLLLISKNEVLHNNALIQAARHGNLRILKHFVESKFENFYTKDIHDAPIVIIFEAAEYGHIEIVEFAMDLGADCYDDVMILAAECGFIDIIQLMEIHGATDYSKALIAAAEHNHKSLVEYFLDNGVEEGIELAMIGTIESDFRDIFKLLIDYVNKANIEYDINEIKSQARAHKRQEILGIIDDYNK